MREKIYNLIGLARRAGKVAIGMSMLEQMARRRKVVLILIAEDASKNTVDKVLSIAPHVKYLVFGTADEWGRLFNREKVAVIGLLDPHFAEGVLLNYDTEEGKMNGGKQQ